MRSCSISLYFAYTLQHTTKHTLTHLHRVEDMMKRSFAELDYARHEVDRKQALEELEQNIGSLEHLDCPLCATDIDHYYGACARVAYLRREMQVYV